MRVPSLSLALARVAKSTIANGFLLLVIGLAVILALSVFTTLPQSSVVLLPHQPQSAFATSPEENGKIAFFTLRDGNHEIYVMNPDGSGQTKLTNNPAGDAGPDWGTAPPSPPAPTCRGEASSIIGTAGNDDLVGTSNRDIIAGLGGNDHISGLGGNDLMCGDNGSDTMAGGAGNDIIAGGSGNDQMSGGSGSNDQLLGEGGNDGLAGGADTDSANGGTGTNDTCTAETETNCES